MMMTSTLFGILFGGKFLFQLREETSVGCYHFDKKYQSATQKLALMGSEEVFFEGTLIFHWRYKSQFLAGTIKSSCN